MKENASEVQEGQRVELEVARLFSSVFIQLDTCDDQLMRRFGLTTTQYWAIVHLEDPQGRSLGELATKLLCDKSNVTSIVDRLEELGLAERKRGKAGDRRYTRVVLTDSGRTLRRRSIAAREHIILTRLGPLGQENLQQLQGLLEDLDHQLAQQYSNGDVAALLERATD